MIELREFHDDCCTWAREHKEKVVSDEGVDVVIASTVVVHSDNGVLFAQIDDTLDALTTALTGATLLRPCLISLIGEAFCTNSTLADDEFIEAVGHGDLGEAFAAGDERVFEACVVTSFDSDGVITQALPYRYDKHAEFVVLRWLDPDRDAQLVSYANVSDEGQLQITSRMSDAFHDDADDVLEMLTEPQAERFVQFGQSLIEQLPDAQIVVGVDAL
jgi:hypothetical protein